MVNIKDTKTTINSKIALSKNSFMYFFEFQCLLDALQLRRESDELQPVAESRQLVVQ